MRLLHLALPLATTLLLSTPPAVHAGWATSPTGEDPFFRLMAHALEVDGEAISYFTYRPGTWDSDTQLSVLLLISEGPDGAMVGAQAAQLMHIARDQGALLVLLDGSRGHDRRALELVLDEVLVKVG